MVVQACWLACTIDLFILLIGHRSIDASKRSVQHDPVSTQYRYMYPADESAQTMHKDICANTKSLLHPRVIVVLHPRGIPLDRLYDA